MIELEKNFPSDEVLERLADALNIDPTELFSRTCFPQEQFVRAVCGGSWLNFKSLQNSLGKYINKRNAKPYPNKKQVE